jgi:hypothetical protein
LIGDALANAAFVFVEYEGAFFTTDFLAWYGARSLAVLILMGAMALWGFRLALGSRPLFTPAALGK